MNISVEISMYPLVQDYEPPILDFIQDLNQHKEILVQTNGMSTQVFGPYDLVMDVLKTDIKRAFEKSYGVSMVMKILNKDTSDTANREQNF